MIVIADIAVVLSAPWPGARAPQKCRQVAPTRPAKARAPVSLYALNAVEQLQLAQAPGAMACISGPNGVTVDVFQRAWRLAPDQRLTGPGFYPKRYKKIHPLTLVRSLGNQTAAVIADSLGWAIPCLNTTAAATSLAVVLPNIEVMLNQYRSLLLLIASAGERGEDAVSAAADVHAEAAPLEGAVAFLLRAEGGGPRLEWSRPSIKPTEWERGERQPLCREPVLAEALHLARLFVEDAADQTVVICDGDRHQASLLWRNA